MKRLLLAGLLLVLVSLVAGCGGNTSLLDTTPAAQEDTIPDSGGDVVVYDEPSVFSADSGLWLKGAEVFIEDLYPGCCPDSPVEFEVGNGINDDVVREIYVSIVPEDDIDLKGYEQLPSEHYDWFTIDIPFFVLQPGESQIIHVTVVMPEGIDYSGMKARCALLIMGYTVVGTTVNDEGITVNVVSNVPIGLASEWYIETY